MDFELLQENPNNQTSVKITSPKAIIDPSNNNLEILESTIEYFCLIKPFFLSLFGIPS